MRLLHINGIIYLTYKHKVIHYLYCCTAHFENSLNITHQQMH